MSIPSAWPQVLDFFGTPLVIEPSPGQLSSAAGLLPVRQFDQRIGLTRAVADALDDSLTKPATSLVVTRMNSYRMTLIRYHFEKPGNQWRFAPLLRTPATAEPTNAFGKVARAAEDDQADLLLSPVLVGRLVFLAGSFGLTDHHEAEFPQRPVELPYRTTQTTRNPKSKVRWFGSDAVRSRSTLLYKELPRNTRLVLS